MGGEVHQGVLGQGQGQRATGDQHHEQLAPPQAGAVHRRLRGQVRHRHGAGDVGAAYLLRAHTHIMLLKGEFSFLETWTLFPA